MMNNMFSMFDPASSYFSTSWLTAPLVIITFNKMSIFQSQNKTETPTKMLMLFVFKELSQINEKKNKATISVFSTVFFMVLIMNLAAIFPFNFTPTAHLVVTFSMALTMWLSIIGLAWLKNFKKTMTHLTPMGTPNSLMNFMVLVEMISNMIRPVTLSVRLSANMVAGHLLMSLLSNCSMNSMMHTTISVIPMTILILLEMGVALVQAYVMATLLTLYQNES